MLMDRHGRHTELAAKTGRRTEPRARRAMVTRGGPHDSEDYGANSVATLSNVVFAFVPIELMAVKQTMMISANITAYSTAVGPSSETKKRCTFEAKLFMGFSSRFEAARRTSTMYIT
jgi:hypothetical protein